MSFIQSKATLAAAAILADIQKLRNTYYQSIDHLNSVVRNFLSLSDEDLMEFGNMMTVEEMQTLLGLHAQLGVGTNQSVAAVEQLLSSLERREINILKQADVRPLADKLAAQDREMIVDEQGLMTIRPIAHAPELLFSTDLSATVGELFTIDLTATHNPESFVVTDLPPWLVQTDNVLSGTPDSEGVFTLAVEAIGLRGATNGPVTITVTASLPLPPEPDPIIEE